MSVLNAQDLAVAYGAQDVFSGITVSVAHGERIGLVGPNGEGKTSLLRVLGDLQPATSGTVTRRKGLRIGYLPQVSPPPGDQTLRDEMLSVFTALRAQQAELAELEQAMADPAQRDDAVERYGRLQPRFEADGGYTYEQRIEQVLTGLGFDHEELDQPLAYLSGGQRTRALLARLLLEQPDLLLLDEPTNHLDLEALEWLEGTLLKWEGSIVVVAHDRYFLDKVATRIWDLAFGQLESYRGNYSHYVQQRSERIERQEKVWVAQQEYIARTEFYIQRYMAGERTRQAQGRLKRLERFKQDEAIARPRETKRIKLDINTKQRSGNIVLRSKDLAVGYPGDASDPDGSTSEGHLLFRSPDLEMLRLQRVALIGPNGSGKTTFLKTILGQLEPLEGRLRLGSSVIVGYLAQLHAGLDPQKTVLDTILSEKHMLLEQARTFLGRFLFSGDDVFKRVEDLSGGERSRVALACLTLREANFLLLDEPTNHLDIATQEILEQVIRDFQGTVLLVSHDRYLVDALATHVWALQEGRLRTYKGGYSAYLESRAREKAEAAAEASRAPADTGDDWREKARAERRAQRQEERAAKARAERLGELERAIEEQEAKIASLHDQVAAASEDQDVQRLQDLGLDYQQAEVSLHKLLDEWAELA